MGVKKQHLVPRVYLKNWETRVSSKKDPRRYFQGIYHYCKDDLETGDGKNKDSVLWESRLYNIDYKRSFMIPSCPKIEEDYITQIEGKLTSRGVVAYYEEKMLVSRNDLIKHFFQLDDWNFKYQESMNQAGKRATLNDIKSIHSYVFESAIDLMSYLTLIKLHGINNFKHHLLSMGGTSYIPIEKYLERNPQIKKITLCLDADDEGQFFAQKIKEKFGESYELKSHIPKGKDFNEELITTKKNSYEQMRVSDFNEDYYEI